MYAGMRVLIMTLIAVELACGDSTASSDTAPAGIVSPPSKPPTVVGLQISPTDSVMKFGAAGVFSAYYSMSDASRVAVRASWYSTDDMVVTIDPVTGYAFAVGSGSAVILAHAGNHAAGVSVEVHEPAAMGVSDALVVQDFSITEFPYPWAPGYQYAPQLRVAARPGRFPFVLILQFSVPGLDAPRPIACGAQVTPGVPRDLNGEDYGEWTLSFGETGHRASGADATAIISFVDETGMLSTLTVRGPVVSGGPPASYGGAAGACFHGYSGG